MKEFREILKRHRKTAKEFSKEIGMSYSGYRSSVSRGTPKWVKAFVVGYKLGRNETDTNKGE